MWKMLDSSDFLVRSDQPTRPLGRVIRDLDRPAAKGDVIQTRPPSTHVLTQYSMS